MVSPREAVGGGQVGELGWLGVHAGIGDTKSTKTLPVLPSPKSELGVGIC